MIVDKVLVSVKYLNPNFFEYMEQKSIKYL